MKLAPRLISIGLAVLLAAGSLAPASAGPFAAGAPAGSLASSDIVKVQIEPPPQRRKGGLFRFLFKNRRERQQVAPREFRLVPRQERAGAPAQREEPRRQSRQRRQERAKEEPKPRKERKQRKSRPAAAAPVETKAVEKAPDAKRILVMGDFMGGALAKGLTEAFAQNANVVVIDATKGDSGLVRADYYDWAAELPAVMEAHKPEALLMMIGANDRQSISTEAGSQKLGSDAWRLAYASRVSALADALKATTRPVLWVGLAPVKPSEMSRDYSALNGIFREQLESRGMRYIDVWNGFADENGKFVQSGPDVSGQSAQLRTDDGINFSKAGQRKLAFFVERELGELLGTAQPLLAAAAPAEPSHIEPAGQAPRIGPMIPLDAVAVVGDSLSAGTPPADPQRGAVAATISGQLVGTATAGPPVGRADDYSWPLQPRLPIQPAPNAATPPATPILPAGAAVPPPGPKEAPTLP